MCVKQTKPSSVQFNFLAGGQSCRKRPWCLTVSLTGCESSVALRFLLFWFPVKKLVYLWNWGSPRATQALQLGRLGNFRAWQSVAGSRPGLTTIYGVWTDGWRRGVGSPPEPCWGALQQGTELLPGAFQGQHSHLSLKACFKVLSACDM